MIAQRYTDTVRGGKLNALQERFERTFPIEQTALLRANYGFSQHLTGPRVSWDFRCSIRPDVGRDIYLNINDVESLCRIGTALA